MNIFLVDLEAVETRYTGQWKSHVPNLLRKEGHHVQIISGPTDIPSATTPGAFLNFGGTNIYKASQVEQKFAELIVQECSQLILDKKMGDLGDNPGVKAWEEGYNEAVHDCYYLIRKHFGVEE